MIKAKRKLFDLGRPTRFDVVVVDGGSTVTFSVDDPELQKKIVDMIGAGTAGRHRSAHYRWHDGEEQSPTSSPQ